MNNLNTTSKTSFWMHRGKTLAIISVVFMVFIIIIFFSASTFLKNYKNHMRISPESPLYEARVQQKYRTCENESLKEIEGSDIIPTPLSPLHKAVIACNYKEAEKLLKSGANPDVCAQFESPINYATACDTKMINLLLTYGADIHNLGGHHPLADAVRNDNRELIDYYLNLNDNGVYDIVLGNTISPEIADRFFERKRIADQIKHNADIHFCNSSSRYTALHHAASYGKAGVAKYLISKGAEIDALTSKRDTPLNRAIFWGHIEMVKILLENGADPTIRNDKGNNAFDIAKNRGELEILELLNKYDDR